MTTDGTNLSYKYHAMNQRFSPLYHLFIGPADRFRLQLLDSLTGQQETREVFAMSWAEREAVGEIRFPRGPSPARLESSISPERRFASLRIGDFSYYDDPEEFNKPVREFFAELAAEKVGALINVFTGELFVLIDGGSFSSTGHLVALLKYHGAGTFIGTETGGSYACNDASEAHSLKHTGLQLGLPRMTFQVAAAGLTKGRGILPDHEIEATIDDLLAGGDPVLEKAIELGSVAAPSTNADADRPHP
jgi:hypothetical protein